MENDRIAKRVYVGECAGSCSLGRVRKMWIDTMKDCLKKISFDVRQSRRMMHYRSVWQGFVTLMRCYSCEMPQPYEALEWRKSICGQAHNLIKNIKWKISFSYLLTLLTYFCSFNSMMHADPMIAGGG